jgi:hypothetical protein
MRREIVQTFAAAMAIPALACSVTGSWRTVAVRPPSAPFPIEAVTFSDDGHYTATGREDGERRTTTGRYRFNGYTLRLRPPAGPEQKFAARVRGETLVLTQGDATHRMSGTLERIAP